MNGLLLIVLGVLILFLVLSGKTDCFFAALRACYSQSASTTSSTSTTAPNTTTNPASVLDTVLSHSTTPAIQT